MSISTFCRLPAARRRSGLRSHEARQELGRHKADQESAPSPRQRSRMARSPARPGQRTARSPAPRSTLSTLGAVPSRHQSGHRDNCIDRRKRPDTRWSVGGSAHQRFQASVLGGDGTRRGVFVLSRGPAREPEEVARCLFYLRGEQTPAADSGRAGHVRAPTAIRAGTGVDGTSVPQQRGPNSGGGSRWARLKPRSCNKLTRVSSIGSPRVTVGVSFQVWSAGGPVVPIGPSAPAGLQVGRWSAQGPPARRRRAVSSGAGGPTPPEAARRRALEQAATNCCGPRPLTGEAQAGTSAPSAPAGRPGARSRCAGVWGLALASSPLQHERLGEAEDVLGGEHQLHPDLVHREAAEGQLRQPQRFAVLDPLLDVRVSAVGAVELGDGPPRSGLSGSIGGASRRCRSGLSWAPGWARSRRQISRRALRPGGEVEVAGQLGDVGLARARWGARPPARPSWEIAPTQASIGELADRLAHPGALSSCPTEKRMSPSRQKSASSSRGRPSRRAPGSPRPSGKNDNYFACSIAATWSAPVLEPALPGRRTPSSAASDPSKSQNRVKAEAAFVVAGGTLLLGVGAKQARVDVDDRARGGGAEVKGPLPGRPCGPPWSLAARRARSARSPRRRWSPRRPRRRGRIGCAAPPGLRGARRPGSG